MFKKDEYIVVLQLEDYHGDSAKENYCFKMYYKESDYLNCYVDLKGSQNGNNTLKFNKTDKLKDWRYATPEEAEHYEFLGRPYNVNTLPKFVLPEKWCVKDTANEESNELYEYATKHGIRPPYFSVKECVYYHFPSFDRTTTRTAAHPEYTEITLAQFKTYVLNNVTVEEDYSYLIEFLTTKGIK